MLSQSVNLWEHWYDVVSPSCRALVLASTQCVTESFCKCTEQSDSDENILIPFDLPKRIVFFNPIRFDLVQYMTTIQATIVYFVVKCQLFSLSSCNSQSTSRLGFTEISCTALCEIQRQSIMGIVGSGKYSGRIGWPIVNKTNQFEILNRNAVIASCPWRDPGQPGF